LQPNAVQPHTGDAFALPANFTLEPRGSGQPLPDPVQKKMEAFFNTSFADVRVHVGPEPSSIGALAFTHGTDLYFAPGQYNPQSSQGQQLLAHELTHVLQQRAGRVRNPLGTGVAVVQDPALEAEAERMGLRAASAALPIQAKQAGTGPVESSPAMSSRPTTVAANGAILPARSMAHDSMQRKSGPILPGKLSAQWKRVSDTFSLSGTFLLPQVPLQPKAGSTGIHDGHPTPASLSRGHTQRKGVVQLKCATCGAKSHKTKDCPKTKVVEAKSGGRTITRGGDTEEAKLEVCLQKLADKTHLLYFTGSKSIVGGYKGAPTGLADITARIDRQGTGNVQFQVGDESYAGVVFPPDADPADILQGLRDSFANGTLVRLQ